MFTFANSISACFLTLGFYSQFDLALGLRGKFNPATDVGICDFSLFPKSTQMYVCTADSYATVHCVCGLTAFYLHI